jgi:hypothetical protein
MMNPGGQSPQIGRVWLMEEGDKETTEEIG